MAIVGNCLRCGFTAHSAEELAEHLERGCAPRAPRRWARALWAAVAVVVLLRVLIEGPTLVAAIALILLIEGPPAIG